MELISFCFPLRSDLTSQTPFLFKAHIGNKDQGFLAPMKGSVVHQLLLNNGLGRRTCGIGVTPADETSSGFKSKQEGLSGDTPHSQATVKAKGKAKAKGRAGALKRSVSVGSMSDGPGSPASKQAKLVAQKSAQIDVQKESNKN